MSDPGYLSAFAIGLAGAGHCLGMCGGIAAALNLGGHRSLPVTLAYHSGRIGSYTLLGGLLGLAAGSIDIAAWTIALRYIAGALLIAMGLYIVDWWRGLQVLERAGLVSSCKKGRTSITASWRLSEKRRAVIRRK